MLERKDVRISVRVPRSWLKRFHDAGIEISYVARSALFQALQTSEEVNKAGSKLHSKQQAAALFNALSYIRNNVNFMQYTNELTKIPVKLPYFRMIALPICTPKELIIMGEFLDQGEYAEEILQEIFV